MKNDVDKKIGIEIDRVLKGVKKEAEKRGIDTRGKSWQQIQKELRELNNLPIRSRKHPKRSRAPNQLTKPSGR